MALVKSAKKTKKAKPRSAEKSARKGAKNGARKPRGSKKVRIAGGSGRIPEEILETPGPACPGAVELLIADRNR